MTGGYQWPCYDIFANCSPAPSTRYQSPPKIAQLTCTAATNPQKIAPETKKLFPFSLIGRFLCLTPRSAAANLVRFMRDNGSDSDQRIKCTRLAVGLQRLVNVNLGFYYRSAQNQELNFLYFTALKKSDFSNKFLKADFLLTPTTKVALIRESVLDTARSLPLADSQPAQNQLP